MRANAKGNMHTADKKPHHFNADFRYETQAGRRIRPRLYGQR